MKKTHVSTKFLSPDCLRDCIDAQHVEFREKEIRPGAKIDETHTALVGQDREGRWTCLTLDGEKTTGESYRTILAAIRNAKDGTLYQVLSLDTGMDVCGEAIDAETVGILLRDFTRKFGSVIIRVYEED